MPDTSLTDVLDRLLAVTVALGGDMSGHLAERGLTESRAHILYLLGSEGPVTQRALAEALDVAPRTVTGLVDGLVTSGHVTREPHPTDRRAVLVTPTHLGARMAEELVGGRVELAEQLFGDWRPRDRDAFARSLDEVLTTMNALLEEDA